MADRDDRGVPDPFELTGDASTYAHIHAEALRTGKFERRALACWGLVARGPEALPWVADGISSGVSERISDASGVLRWIGPPADWEPWLRNVAESMPDGEPADSLLAALERISGPEESGPTPTTEALLLGGTHMPFTEPIWFINESLDHLAAAARSWLKGIARQDKFTPVAEPLPVMLDRLEPWSMPSWKQLLVATTGSWTALFSQGSDIHTADVVGGMLGCHTLRTNYQQRIVRNGQTVSHGDCALWIQESGNEVRAIQASFQSRWSWHLSGEPQPFEDLAAYEARTIPDRFNLERLNQYCAALGIDRPNAGLYEPNGVLIETDTTTWERQPTNRMTSAAWRAAHT